MERGFDLLREERDITTRELQVFRREFEGKFGHSDVRFRDVRGFVGKESAQLFEAGESVPYAADVRRHGILAVGEDFRLLVRYRREELSALDPIARRYEDRRDPSSCQEREVGNFVSPDGGREPFGYGDGTAPGDRGDDFRRSGRLVLAAGSQDPGQGDEDDGRNERAHGYFVKNIRTVSPMVSGSAGASQFPEHRRCASESTRAKNAVLRARFQPWRSRIFSAASASSDSFSPDIRSFTLSIRQ